MVRLIWTVIVFCSCILPASAAQKIQSFDFKDGIMGAPSKSFSSFVGTWHIDKEGEKKVYAVDGRRWEQGVMETGLADKAKALYGERYAEFLDNLESYKYFPLSICNSVKDFNGGSLSVAFKTISGRIDQAAGIAFNIQQNGDYLVVRANALENNLVLFKLEKGKRTSVQWTRNVETTANQWHTLKVIIKGNKVEAYLDNKKYIDYIWKTNISGRIGLWSKADSYVLFDGFTVEKD